MTLHPVTFTNSISIPCRQKLTLHPNRPCIPGPYTRDAAALHIRSCAAFIHARPRPRVECCTCRHALARLRIGPLAKQGLFVHEIRWWPHVRCVCSPGNDRIISISRYCEDLRVQCYSMNIDIVSMLHVELKDKGSSQSNQV